MAAPHHFNMFYVYVLKSEKDDRLYIGRTNDLTRRVSEHNQGVNLATRYRRPFQLVYYEAYLSLRDASLREVKLKQFKNSYTQLLKRLRHSFKVVGGGKSGLQRIT